VEAEDTVVVATTNDGHRTRLVPAPRWQAITCRLTDALPPERS